MRFVRHFQRQLHVIAVGYWSWEQYRTGVAKTRFAQFTPALLWKDYEKSQNPIPCLWVYVTKNEFLLERTVLTLTNLPSWLTDLDFLTLRYSVTNGSMPFGGEKDSFICMEVQGLNPEQFGRVG
jgi:hypothetical protein